jgi:hypothetical protein
MLPPAYLLVWLLAAAHVQVNHNHHYYYEIIL